MLRRYRTLLAVPGSARLLVSSVVGRLPLGMASLAILLLVRDTTHSFSAAGVSVGALALAEAGMAPVIGGLIDRHGMRTVLCPAAVAETAALVALVGAGAAHAPVGVLVGLCVVVGVAVPPVGACARMIWPRITPDRDARDAAYALDATAQEIVWTSGPLIVAVLVTVSAAVAVLAVAVVSLVGTVFFATAPAATALRPSAPSAETADRGVLRLASMRVICAVDALVGAIFGAQEVGLPALAIHLHSRGSAGLLLSVWSIGSMAGGLGYGLRVWRLAAERQLVLLLALAAATNGCLIVAAGVPAAVVAAFIAGLPGAPLISRLASAVDEHTPPAGAGTAFSWHQASLVAGVALGSAVSGAAVTALGSRSAFELAGLLGGLAALLSGLLRRWLRGRAPGANAPATASGTSHALRPG